MWKNIFVSIVLLAGTAGSALAQNQRDVNVEFEGVYWFSDLRANARVSGEVLPGSDFNLERDLSLGEENFPSGRFTWYTGPKSRLFLDYSETSFQGSAVLDRQIVFEGQTFDVGAAVATDLKLRYAKLGWIWQFITSGDGVFNLGTLVEASGVSADLSLSGLVTGIGEATLKDTDAIGLPTLGLAMDINPSNSVNLFIRGSGMSVGRYGYLADSEAGIKIIPFKNMSISGGYRYETTELKDDHSKSRLKFVFDGPFAAVSLRF